MSWWPVQGAASHLKAAGIDYLMGNRKWMDVWYIHLIGTNNISTSQTVHHRVIQIRRHYFRNYENKSVSTSFSTVISTRWSTGKWTLNLIDCEITHFVRNYSSQHSGEQLITACIRRLPQRTAAGTDGMKYNIAANRHPKKKKKKTLLAFSSSWQMSEIGFLSLSSTPW